MHVVELDPLLAWKSIEGYQNELAPAARSLNAFYRQHTCPQCGSDCRRETLTKHAFSDPDTIVPRSVLRCVRCECLFDPHSGIRIEMGNLAKVLPEVPILDSNPR